VPPYFGAFDVVGAAGVVGTVAVGDVVGMVGVVDVVGVVGVVGSHDAITRDSTITRQASNQIILFIINFLLKIGRITVARLVQLPVFSGPYTFYRLNMFHDWLLSTGPANGLAHHRLGDEETH
jgi:hypothetical protein